MKFDQLVGYSVRNIFLHRTENRIEKQGRRLAPDLFVFLKKVLYEVKASGQHLSFNIFW